MEQPNLGKRISELRKAKGLTQEELAEQCKISARTLQRIESGVVTPRAYTVRVIYAALKKDSSFKNLHFEYVKDLFNLKKNTMKKISILAVVVLATGFGLLALCPESKAQKASISKYISTTSKTGITYLYPRKLWPYQQRVEGDTISHIFGKYLVQEHNMNIYLNRELVGRVDEGDTVKLDPETLFKKATITIKKGTNTMSSLNGKNIIYKFPRSISLSYSRNNDEYEMFTLEGVGEIKESGNKIYLNEVYQGEAFANDTVIFTPRGTLTIKSANKSK